ncbi:hypothetical protein ACYJ5M_23825, partial [Pseudomonas amygdali pv. morsprunorum]
PINTPSECAAFLCQQDQLSFNQLVVGSNPTRPTISKIWKAHENADFQVFFALQIIRPEVA